jgi:hypothetical protein
MLTHVCKGCSLKLDLYQAREDMLWPLSDSPSLLSFRSLIELPLTLLSPITPIYNIMFYLLNLIIV